jgi:hypothetical protein
MKNRIEKAAQDYKTQYYGKHSNEGAFYTSDFYEVKEAAEKIGGGAATTLYEAIGTALEAGFMIGYRKAQRDYRKKRQKTT